MNSLNWTHVAYKPTENSQTCTLPKLVCKISFRKPYFWKPAAQKKKEKRKKKKRKKKRKKAKQKEKEPMPSLFPFFRGKQQFNSMLPVFLRQNFGSQDTDFGTYTFPKIQFLKKKNRSVNRTFENLRHKKKKKKKRKKEKKRKKKKKREKRKKARQKEKEQKKKEEKGSMSRVLGEIVSRIEKWNNT